MDGRLAVLVELVQADREQSEMLAELDRLLEQTAAVRARSDRIAAVLESAPSERARIDGEVSAAEHDVHVRSAALAEAEAQLVEAQAGADEEQLAALRRAVVRAGDALSIAEKRAAASRAEATELERGLAEVEQEVPEIESQASSLAGSLRDRARLAREAARPPAPGLDGVAEWATSARAALVVARSGLETEREAVIRQANELGSAVLGEPLEASSAALVAQRVEQALGGSG